MSQLIVTGSPSAHAFRLPAGSDYVKLPSVTKNQAGDYVTRSLDRGLADILNMRAEIFLSAAKHFQPDFLIVDHAPAGLKGEAVSALRYLKSNLPNTRLILGLRDIIDEAPKVRQTWSREGVYALLDDLYDLILVYGERHLYDVGHEYGLSLGATNKLRFVGYLGRQAPAIPAREIRKRLDMKTDKLVVVAAGGGGDGLCLFETVVRGMRRHGKKQPFDCLLIGGPLMADSERNDLRELLGKRRNVHFIDFTDQMTSYLAAADLVVSMGGYNTICELLSVGTPALIVPRVSPRKEQLIRAEMLQRMGIYEMIHPDNLDSRDLIESIRDLVHQPRLLRPSIPLDGLPNVVTELSGLMPAETFSHVNLDEPIATSA